MGYKKKKKKEKKSALGSYELKLACINKMQSYNMKLEIGSRMHRRQKLTRR